jgi:hypothetical protein
MPGRTYLTIHPSDAPHAREALLTDLLELKRQSKNHCVSKMIQMIEDLRLNGLACRYLKTFKGSAVFELKDRTADGGARVYCFRVGKKDFAIGRAECKKETEASQLLIHWTEEVARAHQAGQAVLRPKPGLSTKQGSSPRSKQKQRFKKGAS